MSKRAVNYEAFLDELGPIVDGDADALARHADFLVDDDEARDLRYDAARVAAELGWAGADYVMPLDLEARLLAALDRREDAGDPASAPSDRTTSPGFAAPDRWAPAEALSQEPAPALAPTLPASSGLPATSAPPRHAPSAPTPVAARPARRGLLLLVPAVGVAALAAAAALFLVLRPSDSDDPSLPPAPALATGGIDGRLERAERAADDGQQGVSVRRPNSAAFVALSPGEPIPAGAVVRTDERTRASVRLSDGSRLVLNHATELELVPDAPRTVRMERGEVVADVAHLEGAPRAVFRTANGRVEVLGTKFDLAATSDLTSVRVMRGAVALASSEGAPAEVRAGEEGVLAAGGAPSVAPVTELARQLAWSELGGERAARAGDGDVLPGIGSLRARRPGEQQDRERPLALSQHTVRVRIVGNVARTEIEEVFRNEGEHTLEGIYRFPLPPDAQIARLALDVDGRMEEGSFVERDRAARIWRGVIRNATPTRQRRSDEEFIWVPGPWHDPAILEWQRGGQFELRVFPIPARGERRVVLAYTQTVPPQSGRRRYVYPMAHSVDGSTRVGRFELDVRVAGATRVDARGYRVTSAAESDATRLSLAEEQFMPKGDLVIDYELPGAERELSYWTYRGDATATPPTASREEDREVLDAQRQISEDRRPYVAFALRPALPRAAERRDRDYVLVVDASQSMVGERYARASRLVSQVVSELERRDRVAVLACDYTCRTMPGGLSAPSGQRAAEVASWLGSVEPAGASDLVAMLREAAASVEAERREGRELHLVYVGDGTATVGYRRVSSVAAEVRELARARALRVSTVGVGTDADTLVLGAMARASGGHYVPYVPGQLTSVAALGLLETAYGVSLESPRIELPTGLVDAAPSELPTLRAGQEVVLAARMERERVDGDVVLRGTVAGRPFEQRYRVELVATDAAGNRFVPRLWAAARIDELQLRGRGEERARIVALSKAFGVMSRHTSLLVLESEAMFRAFRVDRHEGAPEWSGEEDVVGDGVDGSLEGAGAGSGYGRGGGGLAPSGGGALRDADDALAGPTSRARSMESVGGFEESERAPARAAASAPPAARPAAAPEAMAMPAPPPMLPDRRGRPGQWMRRVWYRAGEIQPTSTVGSAEREAARAALRALDAQPDSRDRHRDAVRRLGRAGDLERALEVAEAWVARDRLDSEALTAKADLLGRLGRRDDALRTLTGTLDLAPESAALHLRLARAFERAGRLERACAHRIALAELDERDAGALASALRCERELGRADAADRLLEGVREPTVRTRAERVLVANDAPRRFAGELTLEADWREPVDLDLSIVTAQGTRLSWMGGRSNLEGEDASTAGRERLGIRSVPAGTYYVEVSRTDRADTRPVRGELRIRVLGQSRTVPFTLRDAQTTVARVRVTRESRLEPVTGTVRGGW